MPRTTVLVADDDRATRRLIAQALALDAGAVVIAEAENGRRAVELARQHRPHVVIMDIEMPELDGHGATREILAALPDTRVVIHSTTCTDAEVERAFANGADGFVAKTATHELIHAIRAVSEGRKFVST